MGCCARYRRMEVGQFNNSVPICAQVVDLEFREAEIRFLETGNLGLVAGGGFEPPTFGL
jgi:hypothetical protein